MAKAAAKTTSKSATSKPRAPRAKTAENNGNNIEQASEGVLQKLQELGIEEQLQRDIQWCLGSYRSDGNPVGLYDTTRKALAVLRTEKEKKTKGVTAKIIADLEKAVGEQP